MAELLTTGEAAAYLRLSERKLYELVADGAVPCSKATGRWLFPKAALDQWVMAGMALRMAQPAPPIVGGSHDPLLEWALRESDSGLASLPEGSEAGLRRLTRREVAAAAIHLHRIDRHVHDDDANTMTVAHAPGLHDAVVVAFARREQGLLVAPGNPLDLSDIASVAARKARMALRPAGAGAQLLLLALLARARINLDRTSHHQTGLPDRPRHRPGDPLAARRLRHRDPRGGARRRPRFRAADLGGVRPGAATARLLHARPAGAVRLHARRGVRASAPPNGAAMTSPQAVRFATSIEAITSSHALKKAARAAMTLLTAKGQVAEWPQAHHARAYRRVRARR